MKVVHVIDDDEIVRAKVHAILAPTNRYHLRAYSTAEAFLDGVDTHDDGVVLLDVHLPGLSGLETLSALASHTDRFVSIVMTSRAGIPLAVDAMKLGAMDFIEKPFADARLTSLVEQAFARFAEIAATHAPRNAARRQLDRLSSREREVLDQLMRGGSNKDIADLLGLSARTVEVHRARLMDKLGVDSLASAIMIAVRADLPLPA